MSHSDLPARQKRKRKRKRGRRGNPAPETANDADTHPNAAPSEPKDTIFETVNDYIRYSMGQTQDTGPAEPTTSNHDTHLDLHFPVNDDFHQEIEPELEINTELDPTPEAPSINKPGDNPPDSTEIAETTTLQNGTGTISDAIHAFHTLKPDDQTDTMKASDYLRHLRQQGRDNDSNVDSSAESETPPPVEDPLLTLLRIEAKEADKPTTIEYDDRVFDKKIFQDEEFKEYRKNNVAVSNGKKRLYADEDNIVHFVTNKHDDDNNQYLVSKGGNTGGDPEEDEMNMDFNDDDDGKLYGKLRPNYFVALKITNLKMKRMLKNAQQYLLKELGDDLYERALIDDSTFHVTINAIHCSDDEEVFLLMEQFERFGANQMQRLIPTKLSARIHVNRIGHFRQKVIYGEIEEDANRSKLENIYHALHTQLQNAGIMNQQHRFDPHVTIMKLSKIRNYRDLMIPMDVIKKMNSKYPHDFGWQYVNGLELLSMVDARDEQDADDYYQCISSIAPAKLR